MPEFQVGDMVVLSPDFRPVGGRQTMASLYIDCKTPQTVGAVDLSGGTYIYFLEESQEWLNEHYLAKA